MLTASPNAWKNADARISTFRNRGTVKAPVHLITNGMKHMIPQITVILMLCSRMSGDRNAIEITMTPRTMDMMSIALMRFMLRPPRCR